MYTKQFSSKAKFNREKKAINDMIGMNIPYICYDYVFKDMEYMMPLYVNTLENIIGELKYCERMKILSQCEEYLNAIHSKNYGHGDFKAKNIMLNESNDVCVIDFETFGQIEKSIENDMKKFIFLKIQLEEGVSYPDSIKIFKSRLK